MLPLGKNRRVLRMPNMARGTSGSSTRTIIRNIMALKAIEVATMRTSSSSMLRGSKMVLTPASSEPMVVITTPDNTALIEPAAFSPSTSSSLVIGVTRKPS